jgi:hypothetical protein
MDYPFEAALASALAVCDEAVVVVGQSADDTRDWVYCLRAEYGQRLIIREETWEFDRMWQERCWGWGAEMTDAEWLMYADADEAIEEGTEAAIRDLMADPSIWLIRFPFVHLYGTPRYHAQFPLTSNVRLGRRSAGYRMRNWCDDAHPGRPACQMVYGPEEIEAHSYQGPEIAESPGKMLHYGWCRNARAMSVSQAKHHAWYDNGAGLEDGHIPDVALWDYSLKQMLAAGRAAPYTAGHPTALQDWFAAHAAEWEQLEREAFLC